MRTTYCLTLFMILVSLTRSCYGLNEDCSSGNFGICSGTGVICNGSNCVCDSSAYYTETSETCSEKRTLGQSCDSVNQCTTTSNVVCNGSCTCQSGYYSDQGANTCTKRSLGQSCGDVNECTTTSNVVCNGACTCQSGYYSDQTANTCTKRSLGQSCGDVNQCTTTSNVVCNGACTCQSGYYSDQRANTCTKRSLGQSCDNVNQCTTTSNVVCNGACTCQSGYYSDQTANTCTKRSLGQSCGDVNQCTTTSNVVCNGACTCQSGYYSDQTANTCTKRSLGQSCDNVNQCTTTSNVVCNGACTCQSGYYSDQTANTCTKRSLGQSCGDVNECTTTSNVVCNGACTCQSGYYSDQTANTCTKRTLGQSCDNVNQCTTTSNVVCNGACTCLSGYYSDQGANTCTKRSLGQSCGDVNQCTTTSNVVCNGACTCQSGYYTDQGANTCTKRSLGQSCGNVNECITTSNVVCNGSCTCQSDYYSDQGANTCTKRQIYESCDVTSQCSANHVTCSSSFCRCLSGFYFVNPNTCTKRDLGQSCNEAGQCSDGNTYCLSSCKCNANYFDNQDGIGGSCELKKELDESCPSLSESAPCKDPIATCSLETCQCPSNYYDSNGAIPAGSCQRKVGLGIQCTMNSACLEANSDCLEQLSESTCKCTSDYFDTNTVNTNYGSCIRRITLNGQCDTSHSNLDQCAADNAICNSTTGYFCKCTSGYYEDPSNAAKCKARQPLGGDCQYNTDCTDSNAECSSSKCRCGEGYYDTNGMEMDGTCKSVVELRVTNINFQSITTSQFSVSWVIPDEKGQYIQTFVVEWMPKDNTFGDGGTKTLSDSPTTALLDSGISAGKSYNVKITSINSQLGVNRSVFSSADQDAKPNPPTWKEATDVNPANDHSITVSWNAPSGSVYGYQVSLLDGSTTVLSTAVLQSTFTKLVSTQIKNGHYYTVQIISKSQSNTVDSVPLIEVIKTEVIERSLGQSCGNVNECITTSNVVCNGSCTCQSDYYSDQGANTCTKRQIYESCDVTSQCSANHVTCSSSFCRCLSGFYFVNPNTCTKRDLGQSCNEAGQCSDGNTYCLSSCKCNANYFDNQDGIGGSCELKKELDESCPSLSESAPCKDPIATCSLETCQCPSNYYDSNGAIPAGSCQRKVGLGIQCTMNSACLEANSDCLEQLSESTCKCTSDYFDTNTVNTNYGSCIRRITLNGQCDTSHSNLDQCAADNAICNSTTGYFCKCTSGYYEDPSNAAKCKARQPLGGDCQYNTDCTDSNAECSSSKCRCGEGYYDTNGMEMDGTCKSVVELRVTNINFQSITTSQFSVSWVIPDEKGQYIQTFVVEWMPKDNTFGDGGTKTLSDSPTTALLDSGISAGKSYNVKITSINSQLGVNRSVFSSADQDAKPNPPTWKEATDVNPANDHSITVSWNAPSGSVYGYQVSLLDGSTTVLSTAVLQSTFTKLVSTQIKNGHYYTVQIISKSQSNTVDSVPLIEVIKTEVIAPGPPTGANCKDVKDEFILVGWNAPAVPNGDLRQYFIHVYNTSGLVKTVSTDTDVNELKVSGLDPGTYYTFKIYTQNELFNSTSSDATYCQTNAKMSDPPEDLTASTVSSRGFTLTWKRPVNTYSEEILGYLLQVKDGETCVLEKIYKCSDCIGSFDSFVLQEFCSSSVSALVEKTELELKGPVQFDANNLLLPDTTYACFVVVITDNGLGHKAHVNTLTFEEEPQAPPVDVTVSDIRKRSFNVSWSLIGPRPGQVTYTVILNGDMGAESKSYTVSGYLNTRVFADGLEEYWNYSVNVEAKTNFGNPKTSVTTHEYRTLPSAPGPVTDFGAVTAQLHTDNFEIITIQWKAPSLLERNSVIKEYVLKHNVGNNSATSEVSLEYRSLVFESKAGDDFYSQDFDVTPDTTYQFEVYAVNTESTDSIGQKTNITLTTPARFTDPDKNTSQTGMIVGIVMAVFVIVGVGVFVVFWTRRRQRKSQDSTDFIPLENKARQFSAGVQNDNDMVPQFDSIPSKDGFRSKVYENLPTGIQGKLKLPGQKFSAVYISGCKSEKDYIVCFAPKPNNVNNFWNMVLSDEVDSIVMFAESKIPKKESRYWPSEYDQPKNYGQVTIEVTDLNKYETHAHLKMSISANGTVRTLNHYECSSVSTFSPDGFVELVKVLRLNQKRGRILLHSSEGLGSTVPFVVLDTCTQALFEGSRTEKVDYNKMLMSIVKTHKDLLLSQELFIFTHDCVQLLGSCDYEPLQSAQIESVYQTLHVHD
ncbi:uncharacterized protein LOC128237427 isoform X2 [Mya arenaria]|nr:uncharacterized protein LOC128237427 isoform X2 [Mya arenaria]